MSQPAFEKMLQQLVDLEVIELQTNCDGARSSVKTVYYTIRKVKAAVQRGFPVVWNQF